ncbi:MAG: hypothetical protein GX973_00860 [Firmicutes bacterium]|nr:hypothetical protein [Bacillota bacterium]
MNHQPWQDYFSFPRQLTGWIGETLTDITPYWEKIDHTVLINQHRVLQAMQQERIGEEDFQDSTGYGDNDRGREKLEAIYAELFEAEAALVRSQILSGTHALALALFGLLRPGEELLFVTGAPYDTLQVVVGSKGGEEGTLKEWGIRYRYLPLAENGEPDLSRLEPGSRPRVAYIQRSIGYEVGQRALSIAKLKELIAAIRSLFPKAWILVDNCYGEFVETDEPTAVGADLAVGSLIKNPGGGLAASGGYVAGKKELVHKIASRFSAPGLYGNLGAMASKRNLFQGLFLAPGLVGNALKNAIFAARLFEKMGYKVKPGFDQPRGDIVQAIVLGDQARLELFCQAIQGASPIEHYVTPVPAAPPGYDDPIIMAAGTFIQGASGELTADGPLRPPYAVFLQGALSLAHALWATCRAAEALLTVGHP